MFYNALARKGKLGDTDEQEVESVVALHNNMNEKTWRKVLEWEQVLFPGESPKLLKFQGRPCDLSPKAMAKHYILGYPLPYDRHDWTVLRKNGSTVRYIIDYYYDDTRAIDDESSGMPTMEDTSATPSLLIDVRPALDGPTEAWSRAVTMPYARSVAKTTTYEYLDLAPTEQLRSQVAESVQTWDNIQEAALASKIAAVKVSESLPSAELKEEDISEKYAAVLSKDFAQALKDCRETSLRVKNAESTMDQAKARMDLTMCMGKIVCPLPHETFIKSLADDSESGDERIEEAVNNVTECVYLRTVEHSAARDKFPKLFVQP
jgi:cytochrome c heme-lyase